MTKSEPEPDLTGMGLSHILEYLLTLNCVRMAYAEEYIC